MKNKNLLLFIFIFLFLFFLNNILIPQQTKNKPFSILLSLIYPGMGQLYNGNLEKGIVIYGTASILSTLFYLSIGEIDLNSIFPFFVNFRFKTSFTQEDIIWSSITGIAYFSLYVFNIIDITFFDESKISLNMNINNISLCYNINF